MGREGIVDATAYEQPISRLCSIHSLLDLGEVTAAIDVDDEGLLSTCSGDEGSKTEQNGAEDSWNARGSTYWLISAVSTLLRCRRSCPSMTSAKSA